MSPARTTPFGSALRHWSRLRGSSQLDVAGAAATTTRHLSYLEAGRSRPSPESVERLADALVIPLRERNRLLEQAGLASSFPESALVADDLAAFRSALARLLSTHEPYSALVERLAADLMRNPDDEQLREFHDYATAALPSGARARNPPSGRVMCPRFDLDGTIVRTVTVAARFESTADATLDELHVELISPEDADSDRFFHERAAHNRGTS